MIDESEEEKEPPKKSKKEFEPLKPLGFYKKKTEAYLKDKDFKPKYSEDSVIFKGEAKVKCMFTIALNLL